MEARAIQLFTLFTTLTQLFRASDGEYFTELDDVQAYVANNLVAGAYTIVERTTPLPPVPTPQPEDTPIWVRINNPVLDAALRYDNVIAFTSDTLGTLGNRTYTTNNVGGFRPGNVVIAVGRNGTAVGLKKYGTVVSMAGNDLTINFTSFEGANGALSATQWDILLSGLQGVQGVQGPQGIQGPGTNLIKLLNSGMIYTATSSDANTTLVVGPDASIGFNVNLSDLSNNTVIRIRNSRRTELNPSCNITRTISGNTQTLTLHPGEEYELVMMSNHQWRQRKVSQDWGNYGETFSHNNAVLNVDESDFDHRLKVKIIMTATGAKSVNFPLWTESFREIEIINGSPSGLITINLPEGHIWSSNLFNKTVRVDPEIFEAGPTGVTFFRSVTVWKINNTTWYAT